MRVRSASLLVCVLAARLAAAESLGVPDRGIFNDLDDRVALPAPVIAHGHARATVDPRHRVLVVWDGDRPAKPYPLDEKLALRAADAAEVARILDGEKPRVLGPKEAVPGGDADDDGIPDELDIVIGAHKVLLNKAAYREGYIEIGFPGGDVPRDIGVCTDVLVRSMRNAGIDLQNELYADIARAPAAYPMVKRRNPHIDQRRVKTILPWFQRHFAAHGKDPRSADDPFRAGDVLFMDTYPGRDGPEHVGIVSDRIGPSGFPLVVNNWTTGYSESEMDLLPFVPVLYRFRVH
jgi:uncharacterized protein YijF (DUF1287 family)